MSRVIPCLKYRDAPAAIAWLCSTFGFKATLVIPNDDGSIAHAELRFGDGMIMLGSVSDSPFGKLMGLPDQFGGLETQCSYLVITDPDALYERVKAAGASIVIAIKDEDHGSRGFTCRDPQGHVWNFGTYDPWNVG